MKTKFNKLEVGEKFQPLGNIQDRCRKANHYWKRFGRKFVCGGEDEGQYIERVR